MSTNATDKGKRLLAFRTRFRECRGDMPQTDFADKIGVARATVGLYESGQRIPDAVILLQIAERCGVSCDWLLGRTSDKSGNADVGAVEKRLGLSPEAQSVLKNACNDTALLVNNLLVSGCLVNAGNLFPEYRAAYDVFIYADKGEDNAVAVKHSAIMAGIVWSASKFFGEVCEVSARQRVCTAPPVGTVVRNIKMISVTPAENTSEPLE
jgi:transcriptional regulator with XRE-family HTH domain